MWDFLLGEFRLSPRQARFLTWPELDSLYHGYAKAQQQQQVMPRQIAWETHNLRQMMSAEPVFSDSPQTYWPLPLADGPPPEPAPIVLPNEKMRAYLEKKYGVPIVFETD